MKRFGCVLLAAVMVLFMTGSALAEQKVQLPDSRYSLTLPDGLEYDGPGEKPDDARFVYLSEALKLEVQFFCYGREGAALRTLAEILQQDESVDEVSMYKVNGIEMIVYRLTDPDDPPEKGMKCIGYVLEDGDMIQEITFWYGTQDAARLTEEIIGSITKD